MVLCFVIILQSCFKRSQHTRKPNTSHHSQTRSPRSKDAHTGTKCVLETSTNNRDPGISGSDHSMLLLSPKRISYPYEHLLIGDLGVYYSTSNFETPRAQAAHGPVWWPRGGFYDGCLPRFKRRNSSTRDFWSGHMCTCAVFIIISCSVSTSVIDSSNMSYAGQSHLRRMYTMEMLTCVVCSM
jgi:hypothetical protein